MAQHDYNIANASFPSVRTDINNVLSAINTSNSGSSRPSGAVEGTIWLDTSGAATAQLLKMYDGADDILLGTINFTANTVDWSDSSFDIVTDTSPQLGGMLDINGNAIGDGTLELLKFVETGSAVNELTITNNSTGNNPILSATGTDTNVGITLTPKGTGEIVIGTANLNYAGTAVTATGAELNKLAGVGTLKQAGLETIWIPASAMYGATTNPADAQQVETTALRPDMKVLDFDASTDEFAQFSVAFPKSWNEGTVTYQVYWTPSNTDTGNCIFGLQGVAIGDDDTIDVVYGTAVDITDAGIGTVEDQQVSAVSGAITIAGSPAVDQQTYFQLYRDANAGGDTYTGDARVLGIKIFYTTDAANDA